MSAYTWKFNESEVSALHFHGYRYCFTEKIIPLIDENGICKLEEFQAWELLEAWKDDNQILSCGSAELNLKIIRYMEEII